MAGPVLIARPGTCPVCGTTTGGGSGGTGLSATDAQLWEAVAPLLQKWFRQARVKRAFGFQCTTQANPIPFSTGRIGSIIVPAAGIWIGGDPGVTTVAGSTAGVPIAANAAFSFGEEDGDSATWAITTALLAPVDVRCLELLP